MQESTDITNSQQEKNQSLLVANPLQNIALSFSGGGFRAAAFSLGVLSYFNYLKINGVPLLKQVKYIASTSGGTITAAMYSLYSCQEKSFLEFYTNLKSALRGDYVLRSALESLNNPNYWVNSQDTKRRNLINAFSLAYDCPQMLNCAVFGDLVGTGHTHLEEVCFNTTEFYKGKSFRQQVKLTPDPLPNQDKHFVFGNYNVKLLDHNILQKIKLADAVAASSCFPVGFEPIEFPRDFTYKDLTLDDLKRSLVIVPQNNTQAEREFAANKTFCLMDGGITDNQALHSMMYADGRRRSGNTGFKPFDLMMVCDVSSHYMSSYIVPEEKKGGIFSVLSLRTLKLIFLPALLIPLLLLLIDLSGNGDFPKGATVLLAIIATIASIFWLCYTKITSFLFGSSAVFGKTKKLKADAATHLTENFSPQVLTTLTDYFDKTNISILWQMVRSRFDSTVSLNSDVFLKRVRSLIYDRFFDSPQWKFRRKSNFVYDLCTTNNGNMMRDFNKKWKPFFESRLGAVDTGKLIPTSRTQKVAESAFRMPTTLWIDNGQTKDDKMLNCLISTGQFTTCYNLIEYLIAIKQHSAFWGFRPEVKNMLNELEIQLLNDWKRFNHFDPYFLINHYRDTKHNQ